MVLLPFYTAQKTPLPSTQTPLKGPGIGQAPQPAFTASMQLEHNEEDQGGKKVVGPGCTSMGPKIRAKSLLQAVAQLGVRTLILETWEGS